MRTFATALACLLSFVALAQEPEPLGKPSSEPLDKPSATAATGEQEAEVAALYRLGLDLAGKGKYAEACGVFDRITREHPTSDYAAKAEEQMALAALAEGGAACGDGPPQRASQPSTEGMTEKERRREASKGKGDHDGRVELVISQALVGPALLGLMVPGSAGVDVAWPYLTGGLLGLGAGIGIPLAITARNPITEGQAMLVYSGESMGAWNGFFVTAAIPGVWDGNNPFQVVNIGATTGLVLGGTAGVVSAVVMKPTAGEVSMFRSGFTWGAYFGATSMLLTNGTSGPTETLLRLGIASDVGAILGAVAATQWPISRPHMNVVNLSGYAGALGLGLIYGIIVLANPDSMSAPAWGAVLTTGAVAGIVTGSFLTRGMDAPKLAWLGGGTPIEVDGRRVHFGLPMPTPRYTVDGGLGVDVRLAAGRW